MKFPIFRMTSVLAFVVFPTLVEAFCGFYVASADTKLFNEASQVVMMRDGERTVITMANDFKGEVKEFAIVIPVPVVLEREQIHVAERGLIEHLDAYSAPRLVEYFDDDPCAPVILYENVDLAQPKSLGTPTPTGDKSLGVTIEASYTVGEYDILILSAQQSSGLTTWLKSNDYRLPEGAESVLDSYLQQGMRFFVAKVNLEEQSRLGYTYLRPLQIAFDHDKFMLPIRLGMLNAQGAQELYVYTLTRSGRVETTNYRTVKLPTGTNLPVFVKDEFGDFYRSMFSEQSAKQGNRVVFLEYAWDMAWCDPCAADPLSKDQLTELGVYWLSDPDTQSSQARDVYLTRLHVRYDSEHFAEDLMFAETGNRENFQGRYVINHPWTGTASCAAGKQYLQVYLPQRQREETRNLARLTGWDLREIQDKIGPTTVGEVESDPWWKVLWKD